MLAMKEEAAMGQGVERLESRVDDLQKSMESKFEAVHAKLDSLSGRIEALNVKIAEKFGELRLFAIVVVGGGVLSIVARALHWI
jgi:hypothetical protein